MYFNSGIKWFLSDPLGSSKTVSRARLANTLEYGNQVNDIYSCSWSNVDFSDSAVGTIPQVVEDAIKRSAEMVRVLLYD